MLDFINTWQFYIFAYVVMIVIFSQCYKLAVRNAHNDTAATVILQTIAGIGVLVLAPLFSFKFAHNIHWYLLLVGACIFYALNDRLQTTARKHLQVSLSAIILQFSTAILVFYGIVVYKDKPSVATLLGVAVIIAANILILFKKGELRLNKFVWLALLATFMFSTALTIDIDVSKQFNLPIYISATLLLPAIMLTLGDRLKPKELVSEWRNSPQRYYWATGISWFLAIFFSLRAYQIEAESTVAPLAATSVIFNVLVAFIVFHERDNKTKKVIAAALVVAGSYLIAR